MMTTTVSQEAVEVTQADKAMAAEIARKLGIADWATGGGYFAAQLLDCLARHRQQAERGEAWRPIEDCPMWELAIVTDGENVAKAQKAECDYGGFYWSIEPEDALEWEPTHWMPFDLPTPEAV